MALPAATVIVPICTAFCQIVKIAWAVAATSNLKVPPGIPITIRQAIWKSSETTTSLAPKVFLT